MTLAKCRNNDLKIICQWVQILPFTAVNYDRSCIGHWLSVKGGNNKGGSIAVPLTSCLNGLESAI